MNITNATNATIADPQGTVTITDNDAPTTGGCDDIVIEDHIDNEMVNDFSLDEKQESPLEKERSYVQR